LLDLPGAREFVGGEMPMAGRLAQVIAAAFIGGMSSFAQAASELTIGQNESLFVDGKTFQLSFGKAKADPLLLLRDLGAREMGPSALIFRIDDRLYILDAPHLSSRRGSMLADGKTLGADKARTNRIRVEYAPPKTADHRYLYDLLKERQALETLQQIFSPFRLTIDLKLKAVGCDGMVNAWYAKIDSVPTVTMCYEFLHHIFEGAPTDTTAAGVSREDAILGQFFYLVTHEVGHAMFDILDVPLFGREEDAADQFAAYIMLDFGKDRARRLISGAANSYRQYIANAKSKPNATLPIAAFSSTHGQPEERFYNLLCAAYGADPAEFAFLVENEYLPKTRAQNCGHEFHVLIRAFHLTISPHIDSELAETVLDTRWISGTSSVHRSEE
jgi:Putative metallopeptidase